RRNLADRNHAGGLGGVSAKGHVRDVKIDEVAPAYDPAVGFAAMRAELVDANLVSVAGFAAACHLGESEGRIDFGVSRANPGDMMGGLGPNGEEWRSSAKLVDLGRRPHALHPVNDSVVGYEPGAGKQLLDVFEQDRARPITDSADLRAGEAELSEHLRARL